MSRPDAGEVFLPREQKSAGRGWDSGRTVLALVGICVLGVAGSSCVPLSGEARREPPPARLLTDSEAQLFMTRLGQQPKRLVTAAERVLVRCYFDPELVDLTRVKSYSLWRQDTPGGEWNRVAAASKETLPFELTPGEGLIGLRASATYQDGSERLVPRPGDQPGLVLCADKSPPDLSWVSPAADSSIRGRKTVDLTWTAAELQFGAEPVVLEWSADRGQTWKPLGSMAAAAGHQRFVWQVPPEVCSDILVRLTARDMVGHEATEILALSYPGSVTAGGTALAAEVPTRSRKLAEPAATPVTTAVAAEPSAPTPATAPGADASPRAPTGPVPAAEAPPTDATHAVARDAAQPAAAPEPARPVSPEPPLPAPTPPAGASTTSPGASTTSPGRLALGSLRQAVLAGASVERLSWELEGASATSFVLRWSGDAGSTWQPLGTAPGDARVFDWRLPDVSHGQCAVELTALLSEGASLQARTAAPFAIDADPPRIEVGDVPSTTGRQLTLRVALSDPGGSGVARTEAHLRPSGGQWKRLAVADGWKAPKLELDLSGVEEGVCELLLRAVDQAGNSTPAPEDLAGGQETGPMPSPAGLISFHIDATPPALAARATPAAWVSGFSAEAQVEADWSDAVPPLVLEGLGADGNWQEIARWPSVASGQSRVSFDIPSGLREHVVRFSVADAVGNRAQATVGPRPVEPAIRLSTFTEAKSYASLGVEKVAWQLHPAALEVRDQLRVVVDHQPRRDAPWTKLYADLPPEAECFWELPRGDTETHRVRVVLLRQGKVLGEDVSPPFTIAADDLQPTVVGIHPDSTFYAEQAKTHAERYLSLLTVEPQATTEIERLRTSAMAAYTRALEKDPNNYHATYGLAQLLNRANPDGNAAEVIRWLQRTVEIKPDHFWALNDLGAAAIRDGDFKRAEQLLERSAAIEGTAIVLYNLGLALFYGGKMGAARERLEAALKATGSGDLPQADVYYFLVHSYLREGQREKARGLFQAKASVFTAEMRQELEQAMQG